MAQLASLTSRARAGLRRLAWLAYALAPLPVATKHRLKQAALRRFGGLLATPGTLDKLPDGEQRLLVVMLGHLREDLFYAGYSEFFQDYTPVFAEFDRVIIAVHLPPFDARLAQRYSSRIEVMHLAQLAGLRQRPRMLVAFNAGLAAMARRMLPSLPERIVYYCQDFEAGFVPLGSNYVTCERAVALTRNLVVSTPLLKDFLVQRGLIRDQHVFVTRPRIEAFPVDPGKTRRLFFYYRPENFNQRNLATLIDQCVEAFCARHRGYEIFLVGTVATTRSYRVHDTPVKVMSKLPKQEYLDLISSCDVVVALIYSAHPGVIAYQAAASGIPTVTNVFDNRDAALLRRISSNLVPFDPVREELVDAIEAALALPKGRPDFDETLYSGRAEGTLLEFHQRILVAQAGATERRT
jgi:hypothetical protein